MTLALAEAQTALSAGDYPVGAALVADGELWGTGRNHLFSESRTSAHAEHDLLNRLSRRLRKRRRTEQNPTITLYSTLEPCLMCLGITVMHRIDRIVIACPDPHGGVCSVDPTLLGAFYPDVWPQMAFGLYRAESCALILEFLRGQVEAHKTMMSWRTMLNTFEQLSMEEQDAD